MKVIFNGELKNASDPLLLISPFGPPIEFGQSVFETFKIESGRPPGVIKQHWERLNKSAEILQFAVPPSLSLKTLDQGLADLISTLDLALDYRCKVLVNAHFWWIKAQPLVPMPAEVYTTGVNVIDRIEHRVLPQAKAASPLYPLDSAVHLLENVFETLYFSEDEFLKEGSVSNVIAVLGGQLVSPMQGVLPGITVREVFKKAQAMGLKTEFRAINKHELKQASEIFLTNAIKGLVPVKSWSQWERRSTEIYEVLK
jgi:branched-subunit amino acid aminotransferase/4-amino-4-deoxychorismate lyase